MSNPAMNNMPAFTNKTLTAEELRALYDQPAAQKQQTQQQPGNAGSAPQAFDGVAASANPMTIESTIQKTALIFIVLLATAAVGWFIPALAFVGAIVGLVLGLVNAFKKQPSAPLILLYAAFQGLFLGGISGIFNAQWSGIVSQAVLGTLVVFAVVLFLFRSGKLRTSSRMNKIFLVAIIGYAGFSLVNFVMMMTGLSSDPWGMRGATIFGIPLGLLLGAVAILLASYSLVMDFEMIQNGVARKVDDKYSWSAAFGLTVTLIWLYVEILRLLAILRGSD